MMGQVAPARREIADDSRRQFVQRFEDAPELGVPRPRECLHRRMVASRALGEDLCVGVEHGPRKLEFSSSKLLRSTATNDGRTALCQGVSFSINDGNLGKMPLDDA